VTACQKRYQLKLKGLRSSLTELDRLVADQRSTKEAAGSKNQLKERSIDRTGNQEATLLSFVEREAAP